MTGRIITGHVLDVLAGLEEQSVHCIVTSPPYFGVRAYNTEPQVWGGDALCEHTWRDAIISRPQTGGTENSGLMRDGRDEAQRRRTAAQSIEHQMHTGAASNTCRHCGAWRGELGAERVVDCLGWATGAMCSACHICHIRMVLRELHRVLRDDGTVFWNSGDSYSGGKSGRTDQETLGAYDATTGRRPNRYLRTDDGPVQNRTSPGIPPKSLLLVPQRFALAAQADGWVVRNECIWSKVNGLPESVTDRFTKSHEQVWMLAKGQRYFFDQEAVRESLDRPELVGQMRLKGVAGLEGQRGDVGRHSDYANPAGRNGRSVWHIPVQPRADLHFATFPDDLAERCIKAGSSEHGVCAVCSAPWVRVVERTEERDMRAKGSRFDLGKTGVNGMARAQEGERFVSRTVGWQPSCTHTDAGVIPATVLDCFAGSGVTLQVAEKMGRSWVGIELNETYSKMAERRTAQRGLWQWDAGQDVAGD